MDRRTFEIQLQTMHFIPKSVGIGVRIYTFRGNLYGKEPNKVMITTDDGGYFMRYYFTPMRNYGYGNKWVNIHSKTAGEEIRKFLKLYSL